MPEPSVPFRDVCERFSIWCSSNGLPLLPLRVNDTRYPWSRWDSNMAPGGRAELVGAHGERVRIGNLMRYGLTAERSLVSHVWAAPLRRHPRLSRLLAWLRNVSAGHATGVSERKVLAAYLSEPIS